MFRIFLLFLVLFFNFANAKVDYEELKQDRQQCYKIQTSACFLKLINKYSMASDSWQNVLRYDYAVGLMIEENYPKAKENFKSVLLHESDNKELIKLANQNIKKIDEIYRKIASAKNLDAGDYYKKDEIKAVWKNPDNIKVYIASNTGKESILKRALRIWDEKMFTSINFSYTDNASDANIIIKFVDSLSSNVAGITKYSKVYSLSGKQYLSQVNVEVSLKNPQGGNYTDKNLLSIALHEIGHALGITYHSDNLNDIMYYSTESYKNSNISHRDINTLKRVYR